MILDKPEGEWNLTVRWRAGLLNDFAVGDEFFSNDRKNRWSRDDRCTRRRRRELPQLGPVTLRAGAFFVDLRADSRGDVEMERQGKDRQKQEEADPAPAWPIVRRGLERPHGSLDTPAARPCQTLFHNPQEHPDAAAPLVKSV